MTGLGCGDGMGDVEPWYEAPEEGTRDRPPLELGIRPEAVRRMPSNPAGGAEGLRFAELSSASPNGSLIPRPRAIREMDSTSLLAG